MTKPSIAAGEYAENVIRKDFTVSERLAIAETIEGEIGDRHGRRTDLEAPDELPDKCPGVAPGKETRDVVAERAGFSSGEANQRNPTPQEARQRPLGRKDGCKHPGKLRP